MQGQVFTSESVSGGHPDKMCDQVSDAILDACLEQDARSRVAVETLVKGVRGGNNLVVVAGELTTRADIDPEAIVRETLQGIGYDAERYPDIGFSYDTVYVLNAIGQQSPHISQGVDVGAGDDQRQGAGDQGMMFGYACNETEELMPTPIAMANALIRELGDVRDSPAGGLFRPDAKSQVAVRYDQEGNPLSIDNVVVSVHHDPRADIGDVRAVVREHVVDPVLARFGYETPADVWINPTGSFAEGGPVADAGVTGRKIIVDTYGGMGRHGGGAFSGKDPSKVDRSAAYAARQVAKSVVVAGAASRCEVQLAYAIGRADPVSVNVNTFGTGEYDDARIADAVREQVDLTPSGIVERLDLLRPGYLDTAVGGHFGRRGPRFTWENTLDLRF